MECHQLGNVHIADAVAVGHHEGLIADVGTNAFDAPAGHRVEAGVHNGDLPRLGVVVVDDHLVLAAGEIKRNIAGMQEVIREPLLDHVLLVARADDKVVKAVVGIFLHDMPQDGHVADFDHRLGLVDAFFADARAKAASQDYYFHNALLYCFVSRSVRR